MIRAIFFDIDNTLLSFDAFVREAMINGFQEFRLAEFREEMLPVFFQTNDALWRRLEEKEIDLKYICKHRWNLIFKELGIHGDGETFETWFRKYLNESAIPEEGAEKLLKHLYGKYILCAASNGPYEQQRHRMEIAGYARYFDHLFISEKIGVSKPDPKFFERAFDVLNKEKSEEEKISPEETLMIGDSMSSDMAGAVGFGMKTLFYDRKGSGFSANKHVDIEKIDYHVRKLEEICRIEF